MLVAVFPVFAAVAVNKLLLLPTTVGVPAILAPVILKPVGKLFAVYVILCPAALVAPVSYTHLTLPTNREV